MLKTDLLTNKKANNMKRYINKLFVGSLLIGATSLMFTSCASDYLDTDPSESVSDETAVATTENAYKTLNGVAKTMTIQHSAYRQGFCGENAIIRLYENLPSQDYNYNYYASGWADIHNQVMHFEKESIYDHYAWYYYYQIITQANALINNVMDAEGLEADKKFIKASALTFRAYAFEKLVHYFCYRWQDSNNGATQGLPLRVDASTGDIKPSTLAETMDQIYSDCKEAIKLFNESGIDRKPSDVWIPNLNAAHAVYARAALWKQDYETALEHSKLAQNGFPLMSNAEYRAGFCNPTSEWIMGCYGASDENNWYWSYGVQGACNGYYANNTACGAGSIGRELINRIPKGDVRKSLFLTEDNLEGVDLTNPNNFNTTYCIAWDGDVYAAAEAFNSTQGVSGMDAPYQAGYYYLGGQYKFYVFDMPGIGYLPLIRTSEMVLIEAEANYFLGNEADARAALVKLNKDSGRNPEYTCDKSGEDLFAEIRDYRSVELWGEGFQWSDFKRWKLPIVRHTFAEGGNAHPAVAVTIQPNDPITNNWTWVVPAKETDYNEGFNMGENRE